MNEAYLEITFRHGRPIAAYYYLPRRTDQTSCRTRRATHGLLIDYAQDGQAIGIEITSPAQVTLDAINDVLKDLGQKTIEHGDLAPLHAA